MGVFFRFASARCAMRMGLNGIFGSSRDLYASGPKLMNFDLVMFRANPMFGKCC